MSGLNLHDIVRAAITYNHPDEEVQLYFNIGQENTWGTVTPTYQGPYAVMAQVQSESDAALFHSNNVGMNTETVRAYFYQDQALPIFDLSRFNQHGGDMFQRSDGSWWLITGIPDNFSDVGWISTRATLQVNPPSKIVPPPAEADSGDDSSVSPLPAGDDEGGSGE